MFSGFRRKITRTNRRSISISKIMAMTFIGIIALGTAVLCLPAASRTGKSAGFLTAWFTATSATCVTGLVMGDTYSMWTPLGQAAILLMIQIGGLGFMSAASLAYFTLRRRIGLRSQMVMAEAIGASGLNDIPAHQKRLMVRAFRIEAAGAVLLTARFAFDYPFLTALRLGVFHSVSAFCNAGFDILGFRTPGASLMQYHTDPFICLILCGLIILGGLGFLGAGIIMKNRHVSGLTTATGIWVTGAIGLSMGGGMYELSVLCFVLMLLCMEAMHFYSFRFGERPVNMVLTSDKREDLEKALQSFGKHVNHFSWSNQGDRIKAEVSLLVKKKDYPFALIKRLDELEGIDIESVD